MPIFGIVGGIGSGKSLVAAEMVKHGGYLIAGDALGHEALRQPGLREQVVERFGSDVLDETGEINRRRLASKVFAKVDELRALEALVFPFIGQRIREEIAKARADGAVRFLVLDAAVMIEAGWDKNCNKVIFVDAPAEVREQRLQSKRGWSAQEVRERARSQLDVDVKRRRADGVIDNSGAPAQVADQVKELLREWRIV